MGKNFECIETRVATLVRASRARCNNLRAGETTFLAVLQLKRDSRGSNALSLGLGFGRRRRPVPLDVGVGDIIRRRKKK